MPEKIGFVNIFVIMNSRGCRSRERRYYLSIPKFPERGMIPLQSFSATCLLSTVKMPITHPDGTDWETCLFTLDGSEIIDRYSSP